MPPACPIVLKAPLLNTQALQLCKGSTERILPSGSAVALTVPKTGGLRVGASARERGSDVLTQPRTNKAVNY